MIHLFHANKMLLVTVSSTSRLRFLVTGLFLLNALFITSVLVASYKYGRNVLLRGQAIPELGDYRIAPLLCIFTSFKPTPNKLQIYRNTIRNWASIGRRGRIITILYDNVQDNSSSPVSSEFAHYATQHGWDVLPIPRVSEFGVPYLKEMYMDAAERYANCTFYGFSNGDILFTENLVLTLEAVLERFSTESDTVLIVGQRTNVPMGNNLSIFQSADVEVLARSRGRPFLTCAEDYFFLLGNRFSWHVVPDLVIGKPAYDNFLVAVAITNNVSVVDASGSLTALHQTDSEGNFAGSNSTGADYNRKLIGKFNYNLGFTTCAQYHGRIRPANGKSAVSIEPRVPVPCQPSKKKPKPKVKSRSRRIRAV